MMKNVVRKKVGSASNPVDKHLTAPLTINSLFYYQGSSTVNKHLKVSAFYFSTAVVNQFYKI